MSTKTDHELLQLILKSEELSEEDFIMVYQNEADAPAICSEPGCHAIHDGLEHDARDDNCQHCQAEGTVNGAFVLMGVI